MKCLRCSGSFDCIQSLMKLFPEIKRKQWRNIMDKAGETTNSCSQEIQNNGLYQFRIFSQLFLLAFSFLKQTIRIQKIFRKQKSIFEANPIILSIIMNGLSKFGYTYFPYLSPYINFVYQNLMYIEGCNSIKWRYMKQTLCVSIHRHLYSMSNEFLKF